MGGVRELMLCLLRCLSEVIRLQISARDKRPASVVISNTASAAALTLRNSDC